MTSPTTASELIGLIAKSGVLEPGDLEHYVGKLRSDSALPTAAKDLAKIMLKDGLLTSMQAGFLLKGKWRNFIVNGKYKLLEPIGSGGMGKIFLCEHIVLRRRVALKVLPAGKVTEPGALERFRREARAGAALDHPNIIRSHDFDTDGFAHFLVMEYVEGSNLQTIVDKHGPLDLPRAVNYIRQAAEGLQHAHDAGLVHRDIKPGNLLLDRSGTVKILDLGLARFFGDPNDQITKLHNRESVMGTPDYLSPEQAINSSDVDIRSDIYSLGATFYFLLNGKSPFDGGTIMQKILRHQVAAPEPIAATRREVPSGLAAVLGKMMAKNPDERYQTPDELIEALLPFEPEAIDPPPEKEMPRASRAAQAGNRSDPRMQTLARPVAKPPSTIRPQPRSVKAARKSMTTPRSSMAHSFDRVATAWRQARPRVRAIVAVTLLVPAGALFGFVAAKLFGTSQAVSAGSLPQTGNDLPPADGGPPPGAWRAVELRRLSGHQGHVDRVALSPDGKQALSAGYDQTVRLWDVAAGQELHTFTEHTDTVHFAAFAPDGKRGLSCGQDQTIRVWDLINYKQVHCLRGHEGRVWAAGFTTDGKHIFSGGNDGTARLWDAATGQEVRRFAGHEKAINWVAVSPDRVHAATASWDHSIRLWNLATGEEVRVLYGHTAGASTLAFSGDGKRLLSGSYDNTLRLWDVATGATLHTYTGHTDQVWAVDISPDGQRGVSASADRTIRVWDLETARVAAVIGGHSGGVTSAVFLPDGQRILSSSQDHSLRLWQLER